MIRFNCPNCGRDYELPNALARLPLVCKKCGERITPPEPTAEPEFPSPPPARLQPLPPSPPPKPAVAKLSAAIPVAPPRPAAPKDEELPVAVPRPAAPEDEELPIAAPDEPLAINTDLLGPPAPSKPRKLNSRSVAPREEEEAPPDAAEPTMLPFVADAVVFLVLLAVGAFLGELLVRKPTGQIISESGSAPKFPPVDLLLWAAAPVVFGLIYLLLGKRGRSVGAWLRRRR